MNNEKKSFYLDESIEGETKHQKFSRWEKERLDKLKEKEHNKRKITYSWSEGSIYIVKVYSYLQLGEGKINETEINRKWKVNYNEKLQQINLEEVEYSNIKIDLQLKPLYEITEIINKATQDIVLQLDEDKTIKNVSNMGEIEKKWENIKFQELKLTGLLNEAYKQLIEIYDKQFEDLSKNIKSNLLYQIFFFPFSEIYYEQDGYIELMERATVSLLFPGEILNYKLFYKNKIKDNDLLFVYVKTEPSVNYNYKHFQKFYDKNYKDVLELDFDHHFFVEGEYVHNKGGYLNSATFYFKEKVNKRMQYVSKYEIQLAD